jgi:hypothetical protein
VRESREIIFVLGKVREFYFVLKARDLFFKMTRIDPFSDDNNANMKENNTI